MAHSAYSTVRFPKRGQKDPRGQRGKRNKDLIPNFNLRSFNKESLLVLENVFQDFLMVTDKIKKHPNIGGKVTGFIITFGALGAIAMGLFFFLGNKGYEEVSNWMLIAFFVLVPVGLLGGFIMLYNVKCPDCGGKTKTIQNKKIDMWQAHCLECGITWNLGIGTNVDP